VKASRSDVEKIMEKLRKHISSENGNDFGSMRELDDLFDSKAYGFREIVLVMAIAKIIDPDYDPVHNFYSCSPRSLYEGAIRDFLLKYKIPHMKSGPLNVAKAAKGIDPEWASQRRPKNAADAAVKCAEAIRNMSDQEVRKFSITLLDYFFREAEKIAQYDTGYSPIFDPLQLYYVLEGMIDDVIDGGNTPQRIVGTLLIVNY
jgi:hypothetical protein